MAWGWPISTSQPERRNGLLLISAFATARLTMLGRRVRAWGWTGCSNPTHLKHVHASLFRQGCMLYELIPNMPEHRLLPLTQRFVEMLLSSERLEGFCRGRNEGRVSIQSRYWFTSNTTALLLFYGFTVFWDILMLNRANILLIQSELQSSFTNRFSIADSSKSVYSRETGLEDISPIYLVQECECLLHAIYRLLK